MFLFIYFGKTGVCIIIENPEVLDFVSEKAFV